MNFLRTLLDGLVESEARGINKGGCFANARGELYVQENLVGTADGNFAIMRALKIDRLRLRLRYYQNSRMERDNTNAVATG